MKKFQSKCQNQEAPKKRLDLNGTAEVRHPHALPIWTEWERKNSENPVEEKKLKKENFQIKMPIENVRL